MKREQNDVEYALFTIQRLLQNAIYHLLYSAFTIQIEQSFLFQLHLSHDILKVFLFSFQANAPIGIFQMILKLYHNFKIENVKLNATNKYSEKFDRTKCVRSESSLFSINFWTLMHILCCIYFVQQIGTSRTYEPKDVCSSSF